MKQWQRGTFAYGCECVDMSCRKRVRLTHLEYLRRAEAGPVIAPGCPMRAAVAQVNAGR